MPATNQPPPPLPLVKAPSWPEDRKRKGWHLFAGAAREGDLGSWLQLLAQEAGLLLHLEEVDLVRSGSHDLLDADTQDHLLLQLADSHVLIASPPCSSFSRAQYSGRPGPRPVRSLQYPAGFPWLRGRDRERAEVGNSLVAFTWSCAACALKRATTSSLLCLVERPEDLGKAQTGIPASIWQGPWPRELVSKHGWRTCALNQCDFTAPYRKPTRLLANYWPIVSPAMEGWPTFDQERQYLGPLSPRGHNHEKGLAGRAPDGSFLTTPAAAYPTEMCRCLAQHLVKQLVNSTPTGGASESAVDAAPAGRPSGVASAEEGSTSEEDEFHRPKRKKGDGWVSRSTPLQVEHGLKARDLRDGGGLCSPGRWAPEERSLPPQAAEVRELFRQALKDWTAQKAEGELLRLYCLMATNRIKENLLLIHI